MFETRDRPLTQKMSAIAILVALTMDLAAGRWGSYLLTPVPGLYLPDALLVLGAALALPQWRALRRLGLKAAAPFIAAAGFVVVLVSANRLSDSTFSYLFVRDVASFLYLALVPFLWLGLSSIRTRTVVLAVRTATVAFAAGYLLGRIGILNPFESAMVGDASRLAFDYRPDMAGIACGVGFYAWGGADATLRPRRLVQVLLLAVGLTTTSRAGLVTLMVVVFASVWLERRVWRLRYSVTTVGMAAVVVVCVLPILTSLAVQSAEGGAASVASDKPASASTDTPTANNTPSIDSSASGATATTRLISNPSLTDGTAEGRRETWSMVVSAAFSSRAWILGYGPGTDALYEICTGIPKAPMKITSTVGSEVHEAPKCPVDDRNAPTTLRDPHNWILNLLIYVGLSGLIVFLWPIVQTVFLCRRIEARRLGTVVIGAFMIAGLFGVVLSAPYALLPISVMLAHMLDQRSTVATLPSG